MLRIAILRSLALGLWLLPGHSYGYSTRIFDTVTQNTHAKERDISFEFVDKYASKNASHLQANLGLEATQFQTDNFTALLQIGVNGKQWTVYEDLSRRDGEITFVSSTGEKMVLAKTAEPTFWQEHAKYPRYMGLNMSSIGLSLNDMLADRLLKNGEPVEEEVAAIIPGLGSLNPGAPGTPGSWTSFVGNVQANDNAPVFGDGNTRSYKPQQQFPFQPSKNRYEGLVGGWMPAVRKVHPVSENNYTEIIIFGDVDGKDPFAVQTWHRTAQIENGKMTRVLYGKSYPEFGPFHRNPTAEQFYKALFRFSTYWEGHLADFADLTLPDESWSNMAKYAFVQELMVRPAGVYPKYGAIDRDYYGSEYDGFQDIFTSSLSANLAWGRFKHAHDVIDNYFTLFVTSSGGVKMRGPEISQFGMTLSLLAQYAKYTKDYALIAKHEDKILAIATGLLTLHDESLQLPKENPGHGLIHGWSESDASLKSDPGAYWKPYFANSAWTARGLKDISSLDMLDQHTPEWNSRAGELAWKTIEKLEKSILSDKIPSYVPPLPGTNKTFRESMATDKPSPQDWPHRLYTELLHAAVTPPKLSNLIHDTMRAYGATSLGVVANVGVPSPVSRDILGFISYGYAYSLLLLDRIDEFVLFLYTHRYHVHSRGVWRAAEVATLAGDRGMFCIPAQLTIPSIIRWALVLEHPDEEVLFVGRGVPRAWIDTGKEISIRKAPTRWGYIDFGIRLIKETNVVRSVVRFTGPVPKFVELKLRVPKGRRLVSATLNGQPAKITENDSVLAKIVSVVKELKVEAKIQ